MRQQAGDPGEPTRGWAGGVPLVRPGALTREEPMFRFMSKDKETPMSQPKGRGKGNAVLLGAGQPLCFTPGEEGDHRPSARRFEG